MLLWARTSCWLLQEPGDVSDHLSLGGRREHSLDWVGNDEILAGDECQSTHLVPETPIARGKHPPVVSDRNMDSGGCRIEERIRNEVGEAWVLGLDQHQRNGERVMCVNIAKVKCDFGPGLDGGRSLDVKR